MCSQFTESQIGMENLPSRPSDFPINTLNQLILEKCRDNADDIFLIDPATDDRMTYGEVLAESKSIAASMAERGIEKGDKVATVLPNSLEHVLLWFGCVLNGAIWTPINDSFTSHELSHAIEQVEPEMIVVDDGSVDQYERVDATVDLEFGIGSTPDRYEPVEDLYDSNDEVVVPSIEPSDPAILVFTGGTTGMPKPVLLPHFAPFSGAYRYRHIYGATPDDRHMVVLRLFHMAGQQFGVIGPMLSEMSTVIPERFSASRFFDQVNEYDVTITDPPGSMVGILLKTYDEPVENSLRWIASGWLNRDIPTKAKERFDVDLMGGWAQTEIGGCKLTSHPFDPDEEIPEQGEPVGRPYEWADIEIHDDENAKVQPGTVGEICIRPTIPSTMMDRYYNNLEATIETWGGLWIHSGDLGVMDEDGMLYFVGRMDHFIRVKGENVSVYEVENTLNEHSAIDESAVIGLENEDIGGDEIKAFLKVKEEVTPEEVFDWLGERLSEYKLPRYIEFVDEMPRSETKEIIQREELKKSGNKDSFVRDD